MRPVDAAVRLVTARAPVEAVDPQEPGQHRGGCHREPDSYSDQAGTELMFLPGHVITAQNATATANRTHQARAAAADQFPRRAVTAEGGRVRQSVGLP